MKEMQPALRSPEEVQRAHHILMSLIFEDDLRGYIFSNCEPAMAYECLKAQCDILCWVSRHEHNQTFAKHLRQIEAGLREAGVEILNSGELKRRPPKSQSTR